MAYKSPMSLKLSDFQRLTSSFTILLPLPSRYQILGLALGLLVIHEMALKRKALNNSSTIQMFNTVRFVSAALADHNPVSFYSRVSTRQTLLDDRNFWYHKTTWRLKWHYAPYLFPPLILPSTAATTTTGEIKVAYF